jgi:hypothetical protein
MNGCTCLPGNEVADKTLEAATLDGPLVSIQAFGIDVCTFLHLAVLFSCQEEWTNTQHNKL